MFSAVLSGSKPSTTAKLAVGVLGRHGVDRVAVDEADADDRVVARVGQLARGGPRGPTRARRRWASPSMQVASSSVDGLRHAGVRRVVERLVATAADVVRETDLGTVAAGGLADVVGRTGARRRARIALLATAGERERRRPRLLLQSCSYRRKMPSSILVCRSPGHVAESEVTLTASSARCHLRAGASSSCDPRCYRVGDQRPQRRPRRAPWRRGRRPFVHAQVALVEVVRRAARRAGAEAAHGARRRGRGTRRSPRHRGSARWRTWPSSPSTVSTARPSSAVEAVLVDHRRHAAVVGDGRPPRRTAPRSRRRGGGPAPPRRPRRRRRASARCRRACRSSGITFTARAGLEPAPHDADAGARVEPARQDGRAAR